MGKVNLHNPFKQPWRTPFLIAVGSFGFYLYLNRAHLNLPALFRDTILVAVVLTLWLAFFSQFTLPVKTIHERLRSIYRLFIYPLGLHGPAISIIDGEIQKRKGEEQRSGPGVILLDTASAALLKTPSRFIRAIGPGVTFTRRRETVSFDTVVDLHPHKQTIGLPPYSPTAPSPFAEKGKKETLAEFQARQNQRNELRALTRDGIEVLCTITVHFRLESNPGEGNTQFGFRPASVEKAILGQNIDLNLPIDAANRNRRWDWLPAHLAADVWRELMGKFTLNDLFHRNIGEQGAMPAILKVVRARLMAERAPILNDFGSESEENEESREYRLLKKRGIQVTRVEIYNLRLPDEIEAQLVQRWNASWLIRARQDRVLVDRQRDYVIQQAQDTAHIRAAEGACQLFKTPFPDEPLSGQELLKLLLRGSLEMCERDPALHSMTVEEITQLQEILNWVEKQPDL